MGTRGGSVNGWRRFWDRGRWWKALLAAVAYLVLYEAASLLVGVLWGAGVSADLFADARSVLIGLLLPLVIGAVVLLAFVASVRWFRPLFGPQPIRGRWWMWIAVVLTVVPIALRLAGIDYGRFPPGVVALTFLSGLFIGFTEELLTRGIAVKILRDAGFREVVVAVISSALFALLHSVNVLTGQPPLTVLLTVVFAFGFGMMMYLVLRVTGNLVWPMLIHALTDPTTFLASGGIDVATGGTQNPLLALAGPFNILFVVAGLLAIIFIRGRVRENRVA
ncbi:CPBP family intramembrane glutamic endopeptidase [Leifsonia sp. NPDC077715]|uniref:CPBP family intramembrane glutamic endopeptidase n=1 Tax=Leifsonia sp. NPDC077715 TaxID=3155539 RepID=UPI00343F7AB5